MISVTIEAQVSDEKLLYLFIDWMLACERMHPDDIHLRVLAEGGDQKVGEVWKMFERLGLDVKFASKEKPHGTPTKET